PTNPLSFPTRRSSDLNFPELTAPGFIDPDHPEASSVEVTIQTASIRTHNPQRDNDLRSSILLEVDKYPTMNFKSTRIEQTGPDRDRKSTRLNSSHVSI